MMSGARANEPPPEADDLQDEYHFDDAKARPNRFAASCPPGGRLVSLDPDIARVFSTAESVNSDFARPDYDDAPDGHPIGPEAGSRLCRQTRDGRRGWPPSWSGRGRPTPPGEEGGAGPRPSRATDDGSGTGCGPTGSVGNGRIVSTPGPPGTPPKFVMAARRPR